MLKEIILEGIFDIVVELVVVCLRVLSEETELKEEDEEE